MMTRPFLGALLMTLSMTFAGAAWGADGAKGGAVGVAGGAGAPVISGASTPRDAQQAGELPRKRAREKDAASESTSRSCSARAAGMTGGARKKFVTECLDAEKRALKKRHEGCVAEAKRLAERERQKAIAACMKRT